MRADEQRPSIRTKHQLDHAVPTVIHDPEEDMPVLRRWVRHAMDNPLKFWGLVVGLAAALFLLSLLASGGLPVGRPATDAAWAKLESAKTAADRVEIAKEFPHTPAERWARL